MSLPNLPFAEQGVHSQLHHSQSASLLFGEGRTQHGSTNELASRAHSVALHHHAPIVDYSQGYSPHMHQAHSPLAFHNTPLCNETSIQASLQTVQNTLQLLVNEVQKMGVRITDLELANQKHLADQQVLTDHIKTTEEGVQKIQEDLSVVSDKTNKTTGATKNISNQHLLLKPIVHTIFYDLLGVEKTLGHEDRMKYLVERLEPLPNDAAIETVDGTDIWRPLWSENIKHKINAKFIQKVVDCVWANETANRNNPGRKAEMSNEDYDHKVIETMTKSYWRNIASQVTSQADGAGLVKLRGKQADKRRWARRAHVANTRHEAVPEFHKRFPDAEGAMVLVDTNFGSDYMTFKDDKLSEDSKRRRKEQDVPASGWKRYVAFLRMLDLINKGLRVAGETSGDEEPPIKCRKMDTPTKGFDVQASKMADKSPGLGKAKPSVPYKTMVNPVWLAVHPSEEVMTGMEWLQGLYSRAKKGDFTVHDTAYLEELAAELADGDESGDDS
ncbi:hypothetical protein HYDPIDRAFT_170614 [Hydnomerulius pinastri MD-312]|uniref:Uncharacterized protein n=1 Tax=Hydnomerulius pinastri MD-312 TaxID=994086 RepID=A0A0C9W1N7_9AGAM|nr:hypothetical protein HYDPIDRAFT_170614 [Hydnomerulius pinastri MD-312]